MIARFLMLAALACWIATGLSAPAMAQAPAAPAAGQSAPAAAPMKSMPMKGKAMKKGGMAKRAKAGGKKLDNIADQLNSCELKAQGERAACIAQAVAM